MQFRTADGRQRYVDLVAVAPRTVVGLDFDGVLSPIVDDPGAAVIHPDAPDTLVALAQRVRAIAVVTGRPARQAVTLGSFEAVADRLPDGSVLHVLGQYGNERWDSSSREVSSQPVPAGLSAFREELPWILAAHDAGDAFVEEKGLAVAVHTRRLADPSAAYDRLYPALRAAAERHRLALEPGRLVIEVRAPGTDKGAAIRTLAGELDAGGFLFAGDDLGDLEAFRAVADLRASGMAGLLVCSGSQEQHALVEHADIVVDGPAGVLALLRRFLADAGGSPDGH